MNWDGNCFSRPRFALLRESQLHALVSEPQEAPQSEQPWTELDVNLAAARYGLSIKRSDSEAYRIHPTVLANPKLYVAVNSKGEVLTTFKNLNAAALFIAMFALSGTNNTTVEPNSEAESQALEQLNTIAAPKGLKVITNETEGYRHHDWVLKYGCLYAVVNQYGTVITTARDLATAETVVLLQADLDKEPLTLE